MREQKTLLLVEAKAPAEGDGPGSFEGYASMFGTEPDSYADVIDPGAYKDTIAPFLADGFIAWSHDWSNPIATPTTLREDERGLFLSATFHTHDEAQRARTIAAERIERGKSMGLSIGYEALTWEMRQVDTPVRNRWGEFTDKVRALTKIKLYEVSLVTVPAQPSAQVTGAKSLSLPFEDHSESVRVAVSEWLERSRAGSALRVKEGRAISEARRARMATVSGSLRDAADEIDAMLKETEPKEPKAGTAVEPLRLRADFERMYARISREFGVSA